MKKRRIEITAFRRRTTLVIRDRSEAIAVQPALPTAEVLQTIEADLPNLEGTELNQSREIQPVATCLALTRLEE